MGAGVTSCDITERKRATEETARAHALAELNRQKDELLARLGHELRNPLTPIHNAVTMLKRGSVDPKSQEASAPIERQIVPMTHLIDDLLDVWRIECKLPASPLWAKGDATRISPIVSNLLVNANKFTDRGGRVSIELLQEDTRSAKISVRDTGTRAVACAGPPVAANPHRGGSPLRCSLAQGAARGQRTRGGGPERRVLPRALPEERQVLLQNVARCSQ